MTKFVPARSLTKDASGCRLWFNHHVRKLLCFGSYMCTIKSHLIIRNVCDGLKVVPVLRCMSTPQMHQRRFDLMATNEMQMGNIFEQIPK